MKEVPYYVKAKLCKCGDNNSIRFSDSLRVYVCKACNKFPPHMLRECVGCGTVYLKNFAHPQHCWKAPLCWDCLFDPLTEDLRSKCEGHEHFYTYTYPPGTDWHDFISEPTFEQPQPLIDPSAVFTFTGG